MYQLPEAWRPPSDRPVVVAVTGGRDYDRPDAVSAALELLLQSLPHGTGTVTQPQLYLHTGCARGADQCAWEWGYRRLGQRAARIWVADWTMWGRSAGPRRNVAMLEGARPDLVVAFPGGRGTSHCVLEAGRRGISVWRPYGEGSVGSPPAACR